MWYAHGQKQPSLFGMLPQEKSNSFPSSFCACLPKACSLQTRVRCPELFLSIEKFQPVWWRLTIPVKMKTASDFFCAEMWNNVYTYQYHTRRRTFHKYNRYSVCTCAEAIFMLRAASYTIAMLSNYADMSSPNLWQCGKCLCHIVWCDGNSGQITIQDANIWIAPPCWNGVKLHPASTCSGRILAGKLATP